MPQHKGLQAFCCLNKPTILASIGQSADSHFSSTLTNPPHGELLAKISLNFSSWLTAMVADSIPRTLLHHKGLQAFCCLNKPNYSGHHWAVYRFSLLFYSHGELLAKISLNFLSWLTAMVADSVPRILPHHKGLQAFCCLNKPTILAAIGQFTDSHFSSTLTTLPHGELLAKISLNFSSWLTALVADSVPRTLLHHKGLQAFCCLNKPTNLASIGQSTDSHFSSTLTENFLPRYL